MDKRRISKRVFRYLISIFFATFMALYFSQSTGYIEYENRKQVELTEKQIKKFEKDVAKGKPIDIESYTKTNNKNYQNSLSKIGLKISNITGKGIRKTVEKSFKFLSKIEK